MINDFDSAIIGFFNQFAQASSKFDALVLIIAESNMIKGAIFAMLLWWAWFYQGNNKRIRGQVIAIQLGCIIAMITTRAISLIVPFRLRPVNEENLDFQIPYGLITSDFKGWGSSFPSDHAVLFFAIATGFMFISKKVGAFFLIYSLLIISLPRIYLGLHYPTDILMGAAIGIGFGWVTTKYFPQSRYCDSILHWSEARPHYFYPMFFIFTHLLINLFINIRLIVWKFYKLFFVL
jgi:undecaprenyl-diphosphatase